jgi:predicted short-subunit dehydrogenase-like oxidoreductase (DUF2520 family)
VAGSIAGVAAFSAAPPDLLLEAEAVLVAVRDDAIAEVGAMLVGTGLIAAKHVLLHCSGSLPAHDAFGAVADRVGGVAAMHPLRAIVDPKQAMRSLAGTVFGIEGDEPGRAVARRLVECVDGRPIELTAEFMAAYHAAAAIASNYTVALIDAAAELLGAAGIARADAAAALLPLVDGTLANLRERGLPGGLTGPIRRGDRATVARHLRALEAAPPAIATLYRQLGLRTVAIARAIGEADPADLDAVEAMLAEASADVGASGRNRDRAAR